MSETGYLNSAGLDPNFPLQKFRGLLARSLHDPESKPRQVFGPSDGLKAMGRIGIVELDGIVVELLPKVFEVDGDASVARAISRTLIDESVAKPSARSVGPASVDAAWGDLSEHAMGRFMAEAETVLERGLRSGYLIENSRRPYLKGRIDFVRLSRMNPATGHILPLRESIFVLNRAENRLIRSALEVVTRRSKSPARRMRAKSFSDLVASVPLSRDVADDMFAWDRSQLMGHYRAIEPWVRIVLSGATGIATGVISGEAWLWNAHVLFERLVANVVGRFAAESSFGVIVQAVGAPDPYLGAFLDGTPMFPLEPDLLIFDDAGVAAVLDTKWKIVSTAEEGLDASLEEGNPSTGGTIARADVYQLYSYARHFGAGLAGLIYPANREFREPLIYELSGVTLLALPFDVLERRFLAGDEGRLRKVIGDRMVDFLLSETPGDR